MNIKTPLAIFTYNRPKHARQLFESLLHCSRLDECAVYIFCDGPKKPEHEQGVLASRATVHEFALQLKAKVVEHEQNVGLAHSIVNGATDLCGQYGRIIVLEDDFILHPFFLNFMIQSLDRYMHDERVAQVAGFKFPIATHLKPDAFFLPVTSSWGWATWQRAWSSFSWDTGFALNMLDSNPKLSARFDIHGTYPFANMMRLTHEGKLDTWDIQWYWQVFSASRLTLYPRQSLVWQNGFDEVATHTKTPWRGLQSSFDKFIQTKWKDPISFPAFVQVDEVAFESLKSFYRLRMPCRPLARLKRIMKRVFPSLVK